MISGSGLFFELGTNRPGLWGDYSSTKYCSGGSAVYKFRLYVSLLLFIYLFILFIYLILAETKPIGS